MDLSELTLSGAAAAIAGGQLSPLELTHHCLERIRRYNPALNCFLTVTEESALQEAAHAEEELRQGKLHGPLHGIPLALKDLYETAGVRTTAGSLFFADNVPQQDAWAVQKLKSAGAVLLGKLNMHEIALGVTNDNPHFGACANPWDLSRISGGSSGGSAVAVAAGLCLGSLGSDTGGSIRIPASLCGVVGLKPTYGRVSLRGLVPLSWNLDHAGPLARRVRDAALLLQAVAGYDPGDPFSVDAPVDDYLAGLDDGVRGWRVALLTGDFVAKAEAEVLQAVAEAAQVFAGLGAAVEEVEVPGLLEAAQANGLMVTGDAAAFHRERLASRPQDFGADVLQRLQGGAAYTSTEYVLARRTQSLLRWQLREFFTRFDLLLLPSTPIPAPLRQGTDAVQRAAQLTRFTSPFNLSGLPALSLPCGFSSQGLPIGLQLVAGAWNEAKLLRGGTAYEQATAWHQRTPDLKGL